jgi:hypothetical protein
MWITAGLLKLTRPNLFEPYFQAQALYNQTVWPVNFGLTGPICARAFKLKIPCQLVARGH